LYFIEKSILSNIDSLKVPSCAIPISESSLVSSKKIQTNLSSQGINYIDDLLIANELINESNISNDKIEEILLILKTLPTG